MDGNSIGERFVVYSFGESHSKTIGVVINGCPKNLELSEKDIQVDLDRRRPGQSSIVTPRKEKDKVEILSGVTNGRTTGEPIRMEIRNIDVNSSKYERIKYLPRPGHADYAAWKKYGDSYDYRGGGLFSGRITASFVMAGGVAKKLLAEVGIEILAHTIQVEDVMVEKEITPEMIRKNTEKNPVRCADLDTAELMVNKIMDAKEKKITLYSIVEAVALNVPVGLGGPVFDSLKGDLGRYLTVIPGVKGITFGEYVGIWTRSEIPPDRFRIKDGKIVTERNLEGGITGGLADGMPIKCQVAFKAPYPSIRKGYETVNIKTKEEVEVELEKNPRDDPCLAPRAVPVVEAMMANCLVDHAMRDGLIKSVL